MSNLSYPQNKADLDLCQTQLEELCNGEHSKAIMSVPPQATDFDMQISAAFDEVKAYRDTKLTPEEITVLIAKRTVSKMEIATLKKALELAIEDMKIGWLCRACKKRVVGKEWCNCKYHDFCTGPEKTTTCNNFEWRGTQQAQEQEGNHE